MSRARRDVVPVFLLITGLTALTGIWTWPLAAHLSSHVPHDRGDPLLVTWILWWSTRAVPLTAHWWNAPAFYPATGVFAFSETLLGLAPLTAPIIAVGHAPVLAYNVAFIASFVFSGAAAYFLAFVLTGRRDASVVAAVAYAFAPYRLSHLNHLQLLSSYWMPVAIGALHLYDRSRRPRQAALFAAAWLMQALACGYYFFFLSLLAGFWILWFAPGRWNARAFGILAAWWVCAALLLAPLFAGYHRIQTAYGFGRSPVEIAYYSADIAGLAAASPDSLLWHGLRGVDQRPESELFPGVTIVLVVAAGLLGIRRRARQPDARVFPFYVAAAAGAWVLALGPRPAFRGIPVGPPGPYALLMLLPGFSSVRVPARVWMDAVLCLAAAGSLVVNRIERPAARRAIVAIALAGLLADGWPGVFTVASVPPLRPRVVEGAVARLGLPLEENETEAMYQSIGDGLPVFNGYSGYEAPQFPALRELLTHHDPGILQRLAADGDIEVTVETQLDPDGAWRRFVAGTPGARVTASGDGWTAFRIHASANAEIPPVGGRVLSGLRVSANVNPSDANAMIDGDLVTRWHAPRQRGGETVTVDLGSPRQISAVLMQLGTYASQFPRDLTVDVSSDGHDWTRAWSGRTARLAYKGALVDPRAVPLAIPVGREGRFVRLQQTASEPTRGWTIVELQILQ